MCCARVVRRGVLAACLVVAVEGQPASVAAPGRAGYRIERSEGHSRALARRFTAAQLAVLETLNRADSRHLHQLSQLVVPDGWVDDGLAYTVLPMQYAPGRAWPTFLVIHVPGQMFGAYESGTLVRWGPVSTGRRNTPTPSGLFALTWRSPGRRSTVNADWFMRWYFNFANHEGLAFHAHTLPGYPASRGCIRLLERDARWLFDWGQTWTTDAAGRRVIEAGTPVFIVGQYDFDAAPPWHSLTWLSREVVLPDPPLTEAAAPVVRR